jgi:hypothetical protein
MWIDAFVDGKGDAGEPIVEMPALIKADDIIALNAENEWGTDMRTGRTVVVMRSGERFIVQSDFEAFARRVSEATAPRYQMANGSGGTGCTCGCGAHLRIEAVS